MIDGIHLSGEYTMLTATLRVVGAMSSHENEELENILGVPLEWDYSVVLPTEGTAAMKYLREHGIAHTLEVSCGWGKTTG